MRTKRLFLPIIPIVLLSLLIPLQYTTLVETNPEAILTGSTITTGGTAVEEVEIVIEGDFSAATNTGGNGTFMFNNIPDGSTITITPNKPLEPTTNSGNITIGDLIQLRRAIIFIEDFTTPCQTIAADVNATGIGATDPIDGVTTFDQVLISQVVLGEQTTLSPDWRFIPADANVFTGNPIPQSITINNVAGDNQADFLAIRSGDVTGCAEEVFIDPFLLVYPDIGAQVLLGNTFNVPIAIADFVEVAGVQFSLEWDPNVISFLGINVGTDLTGLSISNFGLLQSSSGRISFYWMDNTTLGQNLPDGSVIFELEFEAVGVPGSATTIALEDSPTIRQTVNGQQEASGIISDPGFVEVIASVASILGNISSWQGDPVPGTDVDLSGTINDQQLTVFDGDYVFSDLILGGDYTITPLLDEGCRDCITIADIFPLAYHIVGIEQIQNPYQFIAADVDNSGVLNTFDILQMQQMITGEISSFNNNTCWRFIDAAYVFANPSNPLIEGFPEVININNLSGDVQADFIGIRTGDLVGACPLELPQTDTFPQLLITFDGEVCPGDLIEIPVLVQDFESLIGFQGTIGWDPAVLSFVNTGNYGLSNLMAGNFNTAFIGFGVLPFSWVDILSSPTSLPDGTVLFTLSFNAIGAAGVSTDVYISSDPTPALAVDIDLTELPLGDDTLSVDLCSSCDNLAISASPIDTLNDNCCFSLSYNNDYDEPLYVIEVEALNGAQLEYEADDIPAPLRRLNYNDYRLMITEDNLGALPDGQFDNFLPFCLSHVSQTPAQIAVRWFDEQFEVVCEELIELECAVDTSECLYILTDTLICDSAGYKYIATVKNPQGSGFDVGRVKLNVLNPTTDIMVVDSIIDLTPPLAVGDTMMIMFVIETNENLSEEDFCFLLSAHDGPYEMLCCAEIEKCIPFPACDPCEDMDVMAMPIDLINGDSCCYTFTIKNGYNVPGYFTNIEMNILTEGVYFSVADLPLPPAWWFDEIEIGTHYLWSHFSGAIPIDTVDVFDFCLDGVTSTDSVYIEVNWLQEDSIVCYDTLALYCPECVEITEDTVECQPDGTYKYTFNFTNINDLGIPVNAIRFIDDLGYIIDPPSGTYLSIPPVPYGQTSTSDPMILIDAPADVDTFCFKMVMTYLNEDSVNVECCYVEHCIVLPECDEPCPQFSCIPPPNLEIGCADLPDDFDPNNLAQLQGLFGEPTVEGDCPGLFWQELPPLFDFDDCGGGVITRFFEAVDGSGNTNGDNCEQSIFVFEAHRYELRFPEDVNVPCTDIPDPANVIIGSGACDFVAQTYEDEFAGPGLNGCFSILRTYQVINWCVYDDLALPKVIGRDEDCDFVLGEEDVYVIIEPDGTVYIDRDNDPFNAIPVASTKFPFCDGLTNNEGYWINSIESPGAAPSRDLSDVGIWQYTQIINVIDNNPPIIIQDSAAVFCAFDDVTCTGDVDLAFVVQEDCLIDEVFFSAFLDAGADGTADFDVTALLTGTYPNYVLDVDGVPIGIHQFLVNIGDQCGNEEEYVLPFEVVDCAPPDIVCISTVTILLAEVVPPSDVDGDGTIDLAAATIEANELVLGPIFDCTGQLPNGEVTTFSINQEGTASDISQTSLMLTCDDEGVVNVEVHAYDESGNSNFCLVSLNVIDGSNNCGPLTPSPLPNQLVSYPNPTSDIIYLVPPASGKYELEGMDARGAAKVERNVYFDGQTPIAINTSDWQDGLYIFRLKDKDGASLETKVVKIH